MKKISTLSLALVAASSAIAATPDAYVSNSVSDVVEVNNSAPAVKADEVTLQKALPLNSIVAPTNAPAAAASEADVTLQYAYPVGTLFNYCFFSVNGTPGYWTGSPAYLSIPAYSEVTYPNRSYIVENGVASLANSGFEYNWAFASTSETSNFNLDYTFDAGFYAYPYGQYIPELSLGEATYQRGMTSSTTGTFYPDFVIVGGGSTSNNGELVEDYLSASATRSDGYVISKFYNASVDGAETFYTTDLFVLGTGGNGTDEGWGGLLPDGTSNPKLTALGQLIPDPGCAWNLSEIQVPAACYALAGAQVEFKFYGLTANKTPDYSKLINSYTYTFESTVGNPSSKGSVQVDIPFTTLDEIGFELDYMTIEGGMFMVIELPENETKVITFSPTVAAYPYDRSAVINALSGNNLLYGFVDCVDADNQAKSYVVANRYLYGTAPNYTSPYCFNMNLKAEYSYMRPSEVFGDSGWEEVTEEGNEFEVIVDANNDALYQVNYPGIIDDVTYSCIGQEDIPEWLTIEIVDANDFFTNLQGTCRAYLISFELTDGTTPSGCEIEVSYKGVKNIYKINPSLSGISSVVDNGAETVASEYYDLQGRKLSVEPQNGLFIRKDVKADGSVKAVKVVK